MKSFYLFLIAFVGFGVMANAQVKATATVTGTIVTPIAITNAGDMNFGNVAVSAAGGTVVLAPAGTRTWTGGVTLPAVIGTVTAAKFLIEGTADYTYAITIPSTPTTVSFSGNDMIVDAFTCSTGTIGTLDPSGKQTISFGATWNINALQPAGEYVSATPFDVTVNYN